ILLTYILGIYFTLLQLISLDYVMPTFSSFFAKERPEIPLIPIRLSSDFVIRRHPSCGMCAHCYAATGIKFVISSVPAAGIAWARETREGRRGSEA
ncbi:hypothetical protein ALC57_13579, partial [Trachymyrmex cornetzi]